MDSVTWLFSCPTRAWIEYSGNPISASFEMCVCLNICVDIFLLIPIRSLCVRKNAFKAVIDSGVCLDVVKMNPWFEPSNSSIWARISMHLLGSETERIDAVVFGDLLAYTSLIFNWWYSSVEDTCATGGSDFKSILSQVRARASPARIPVIYIHSKNIEYLRLSFRVYSIKRLYSSSSKNLLGFFLDSVRTLYSMMQDSIGFASMYPFLTENWNNLFKRDL